MKNITIALILLTLNLSAQVVYEKVEQGNEYSTGIGTPTTLSLTGVPGDVFKNDSSGVTFIKNDSTWGANTVTSAWIGGGVVSLGAITTPPTKATTIENDTVMYRVASEEIGTTPKEIEVKFLYSAASNVGAAGGSGNYLITLPNGYSFNSTEHAFYTGTSVISNSAFSIYALNMGLPGGMIEGDGFYDWLLIVPYDATRFRMMPMGGNASNVWIGSGWYPLTQNNKVISLKFKFYKQ